MWKVEIEIDEEKVLAEDIYYLEDMYESIDEAFADAGMEKVPGVESSLIYVGGGSSAAYCNVWGVNLQLKKTDWFRENVSRWLWYNSDGRKNPEDYHIEDIIKEWKLK